MLLYLGSNKNIGIFDFMVQDNGLIVKKLSGEFYLKKFVLHDMRNLSHCTHIAIDMCAVKDTEEELLEAVQAVQTLYDSRIIIYKEDFETGDTIISKLIDHGVFNILTGKTVKELKSQILICMSSEGMLLEDALRLKGGFVKNKEGLRPQYIFNQKEVKIAVVGSASKTGTTTTAFQLSNYLAGIGARVSYTEANESGHLSVLADYYGFTQSGEDKYRYKDVEYCLNSMCPEGMDFNVVDFGVIRVGAVPIISIFDVCLLCVDVRPYEQDTVRKALEKLMQQKMVYLMAVEVAKVEQDGIREIFEKENSKMVFNGFGVGLFDGKNAEENYREILGRFITER